MQHDQYVQFTMPFIVLKTLGKVVLVAGEDVRYSIEDAEIETWLPLILETLREKQQVGSLRKAVIPLYREKLESILERLLGERVLTIVFEHQTINHPYSIVVTGDGNLAKVLSGKSSNYTHVENPIEVFCQDTLDYEGMLSFNRKSLLGRAPFLWMTIGPIHRAYISPIFFPDSGPCLECLFTHFKRRSPYPENYDLLIEHKKQGGRFVSAPVSLEILDVIAGFCLWKIQQGTQLDIQSAVYDLHVIGYESMQVSVHQVVKDPFCGACLGNR